MNVNASASGQRRALTEAQQVRSVVAEYGRWNWFFLLTSYLGVLLFVFTAAITSHPGFWIAASSMLTIGMSMTMHDLTTRRRLGTLLGLGIPARIIARAMWYESVMLPAFFFFGASVLAEIPLGLSSESLVRRFVASGANSLAVFTILSICVCAGGWLGPPTSSTLRGFLRDGGAPIKYMVIFVVSVAVGGLVLFANHGAIVDHEIIRLSWPGVTLLLSAEAMGAALLGRGSRRATLRLLVRGVRTRKGVVVESTFLRRVPPQPGTTLRPSYRQLVCFEAMRHAFQALAITVLAVLFSGLIPVIQGYEDTGAEPLIIIISWLPVMAALWTVKQIARWISGLTALRMLPWVAWHISVFILAGTVLTGLVAGLLAFVLSAGLDVPIQPAWLLVLLWVPVLGFVLSPRTGAGVLASTFVLWGLYSLDTGGGRSTGPVWLIASLVALLCAYLRTRRLVADSTSQRQRAISFLTDEDRM